MNCVFCSVFYNPDYVHLLFLLLESIFIYGSIQSGEYEIVIYTTSEYASTIVSNELYNPQYIHIYVNDDYTTKENACMARYDVFYIPNIQKYEKILYLDTDILVFGNLCDVFAVCQSEQLYALEEGMITHEYWGGKLFSDTEKQELGNTLGFSSGILLFRNIPMIRYLFDTVRKDAIERKELMNEVFDQPYLNYHAYKNNMAFTKMQAYFTTRYEIEQSIQNIKHIVHFCGGVGNYSVKYDMMVQCRDIVWSIVSNK